MKTPWNYWIAFGSVGALLLTTGALIPACADYNHLSDRGPACDQHSRRHDIREDYREIHINRSRLQNLYGLRHLQRLHGHWAAARHTDREAAHLRAILHREVHDVHLLRLW